MIIPAASDKHCKDKAIRDGIACACDAPYDALHHIVRQLLKVQHARFASQHVRRGSGLEFSARAFAT